MSKANTASQLEPSPAERPAVTRRDHHRFSVDLDVSLGSDHNFYRGFAENLSVGGVFVATHQVRPVGETVEIAIRLPEGIQVRALGEVRWTRMFNADSDMPPGMGLRFKELDSGADTAIESFLAHREPLFYDDE